MIWFFSGWGFVTPFVIVVCLIVGEIFARAIEPDKDFSSVLGLVIGCILSAGVLWRMGTRLNHPKNDRTLTDKKTGADVIVKKRHRFMFLPMQYYAIPLVLIAALLLVAIFALMKQKGAA